MLSIERYHDISCGHRVVGHESKCRGLHGHNYRITFTCSAAALDDLGRVIDFSVVKERLCMWLEDNWDHKMLLWEQDPLMEWCTKSREQAELNYIELAHIADGIIGAMESCVAVPFNPTAENMAFHLLEAVGPVRLHGTGVSLIKVKVEETRKCSAIAE